MIIDEAADYVQDNNLNHMQAEELEVAEIVMPAQQENKSERVSDSQSSSRQTKILLWETPWIYHHDKL
jgi:hypothetical protein